MIDKEEIIILEQTLQTATFKATGPKKWENTAFFGLRPKKETGTMTPQSEKW